MLAVRSSLEDIRVALKGRKFQVSCINGPEDIVLGGSNEEINALKITVGSLGFKSSLVKVQFAFHTSQVDPILKEFKLVAQNVIFNKPMIPVLSPLLGRSISDIGTFDPEYVVRHCREAVDMKAALESAYNTNQLVKDHIFVEVGPHPVVSSMVKNILGSQAAALSLLQRGKDIWPLLTGILSTAYSSGIDIKWAEYHRDFKAGMKVLKLPSYSWDLKEYWIQYVNDWTLRKGDPLPKSTCDLPHLPLDKRQGPVSPPKLQSTTVHNILEEKSDGKTVSLVFESNISRPDLMPLVQSHFVNGIPLCTPVSYVRFTL